MSFSYNACGNMGIFIVLVECLLKNCYLDKQEILSAHNVRTIALNAFNFMIYSCDL